MRRFLFAAFALIFTIESTGIALAKPAGSDFNQLLASVTATYIGALLSGNADRWAAMHAPAPARVTAPRVDATKTRLSEVLRPVSRGPGLRGSLPEMLKLPLLPKDAAKLPPSGTSSALRSAASNARELSSLRAPTIDFSLPTPSAGRKTIPRPGRILLDVNTGSTNATGLNPWWRYEQGGLPGIGAYMINVGTGNLIVQSIDIDIPERSIDLSFERTYNSMSLNDTNASYGNDDGSPNANVYGNGWTNTFGAHLGLNNAGGISVFDIDGARYDYTPNSTGCLTPPPGMYNSLCGDGSGGGYFWTTKDGTIYYFYSPYDALSIAAYAGRLYRVYGRGWSDYIQLNYYWVGGDSSSTANLTQIIAQHTDGQYLTLTFGTVNGRVLLSGITKPSGSQVSYSYDTAHELVSVGKAGNNAATILPENYGYNANFQIAWTSSPRWNVSNAADGSFTNFYYDSSGHANGVLLYGYGNITPNDGTGTPLQPIGTGANTIAYATLVYSSGLTQVSDIDGHGRKWYYDASGRVTQANNYTGGSLWLVTSSTWDSANNLTEVVDPRTHAFDYAYDSNGNLIAAAMPTVTTNGQSFRPTALLSYDRTNGANNVVAVCDPVRTHAIGADWTANPGASDSLCPGTTGSAHFAWDYSDSIEPFGRLSSSYSPMNYHRTYSYSASAQGGDFGLLSQTSGDCVSQNDATSRCPQRTFSYDGLGNLAVFNSGNGAWTVSYDSLNRPTSVSDPDGVTNRVCYYANGQVNFAQSARQYQLDSSVACGSNSVGFSYDADGNLTAETHHFNNSSGTSARWYDGADRLVEVSMPSDPSDVFSSWLTRYIYDLSAGAQVSISDTSASQYFYAHGNMYKTQRFVPGTVLLGTSTGTYAWYDASGTAYDNLDRDVHNYRLQPSLIVGGFHADALSWDSDPGLLTSYSNAAGDSMTMSYDAAGNLTGRTFGSSNSYYTGSLPSETFTYDADGRVLSQRNDAVGTASTSYNADGNLISYTEPAGGTGLPLPNDPVTGSISAPATYAYAYYIDGLPSSISLTANIPGGTYAQQFSYRADSLLSKQVTSYNGTNYTFAQTFTSARRLSTKSDPYANPALTVSYDSVGGISSWAMPSGTYNNFSYDPEGEVTGFTTPSNTWNFAYSTRGELLSEVNAANPSTPLASYRSAAGFLLPTGDTCNGTDQSGQPICGTTTTTYDARVSATLRSMFVADGCDPCHPQSTVFLYDLAGRRSHPSGEYDALNRVFSDSGTFYSFDAGTMPSNNNTYSHHAAAGVTPFFTTDSGGAIKDMKIAGSADILPDDPNYTGLTVYDRDFFGNKAAQRNSTGMSAWTLSNLFSSCDTAHVGNLGAAAPGFVSSKLGLCTATGLLNPVRADGYNDGTLTFRGVRTYESDTTQWSTPDLWTGDPAQPLSSLTYNYARNNPAVFEDPSGFVARCFNIERAPSGPGTGGAVGTVCFDDGLSDEVGPCGLFCDDTGGLDLRSLWHGYWDFERRNVLPRLYLKLEGMDVLDMSLVVNGCGQGYWNRGAGLAIPTIMTASLTGGIVVGADPLRMYKAPIVGLEGGPGYGASILITKHNLALGGGAMFPGASGSWEVATTQLSNGWCGK